MSGYDVIIVGGGAAGCVLANRLSADSSTRVLLLEAGRSDCALDPFTHMPAALTFPIGNPRYDWMYVTEPEPHMNHRRITQGRGRLIGGSSTINGMIFQRGNPLDYQRWAADPGMAEWSYAHCLPYFKRMETCLAGADEWRGGCGPLELERGPVRNPLFGAFFEAAHQAGYHLTDDVNGYRQEGFGAFDRNVRNGRRYSAAHAYLHPIRRRPNLTVRTRAQVGRITMAGTRATGVEVIGRHVEHIPAGEVVLAGGAFNSPQLLQLSGIGDADHLRAVGVAPIHHLPGVGHNLQDHLEVYVQHSCTQPVSLNPNLQLWRRPFIGAQWLFLRSGPGASNHFEGGGFARSHDDIAYPNLMLHFLPIAVRYDGSAPAGGHGYQVHIGPMYSDARGSVLITSPDPARPPAIRCNYLSTAQDRREWVAAIEVARRILSQRAFTPFDGGEISPGPAVTTDEQVLDWVRSDGETAYHPSCTARMGVDERSVLDPGSMRVHGTQGLRVVDASAMPYVTNANIFAPVVMLAEKAADLIMGNTPLPREDVPYYIHDRSTPTPEGLG